ncbi:MAG: DUF6869 domain-containing protein [Hyphomicrobium sp.]
MDLPSCLDCKHAEQGFPCHKADGSYDFAKVGTALVLYGRTFSEDDAAVFDAGERAKHAWAGDCSFEVEQDYPHLLMPLIAAAMDACEAPSDAAFVAAGLLENAIVNHGPLLISQIEALAASSPKFRYVLSGVWARANADPDVWARVCKAAGSQGLMDTDGRGPSDGHPVTVLSEAEAVALLQTRVATAV